MIENSAVSPLGLGPTKNAGALLVSFRALIAPELSSLPPHRDLVGDGRLLRFLEGYGGDIDEAADAFRKMVAWRNSNNLDKIRAEVMGKPLVPASLPHSENVIKIGRECGGVEPCLYTCLALNGDLVHLELMGFGDPSVMIERTPEIDLLENFIGFFELRQMLFDDLSHSQGRIVRTVQIRDMSRFTLGILKHHSAVLTFQNIIKSALANYPESLGRAVCVNSPTGLPTVWRGISMFLNKRMQDKISFLGSEYHEALMTFLPAYAVARLDRFIELPYVEQCQPNEPLPAETVQRRLTVKAGTPSRIYVYVTKAGTRSKVSWNFTGDEAALKALSVEVALLRGVVVPNEGRANVERTAIFEKERVGFDHGCYDMSTERCDEEDGFLELSIDSNAVWFSTAVSVDIVIEGAEEKAER